MAKPPFLPLSLLVLALGTALGGCAADDEGETVIEGVLGVTAPDCTASAGDNVFQATALLDIGTNANNASDLILPLKVATNLPSTFSTQDLTQDKTASPNFKNYGNTDNNIITFTESEVFFSTDEDRADQLQLGNVEGTPVNDKSVRTTGVAGVVFNQQTQLLSEAAVFATGVTRGDAVLLQSEPFIAGAIAAGGTARIIVNMRLVGNTTGNARVVTPLFPFPVQLCAGCLITAPNCGNDDAGNPITPVPNDKLCFSGNDLPSLVCPQ